MVEKINVLHCFGHYLPSTQNWAYRLIDGLNKEQFKNYVCAQNFLDTNFYCSDFNFIHFPVAPKVYTFGSRRKVFKIHNKIASLIQNSFYGAWIKYLLNKNEINIIHAHFATVGWDFRKLKNKLGNIPLVISFYGLDYEKIPFQDSIWEQRYQYLFKYANLFLCEGEHGKQILVKKGCPENKIQVVRLGIQTDKIPFWGRLKEENKLKLLQLATFTNKKGHLYSLIGFAEALKTCPNMTLTFIGGGDDKLKNFLQRKSKDLLIDDKVIFLAFIDPNQLYDVMKEYEVFIHPSCYTEDRDCEGGAPVVLLDAQATGMPIISTTHCDIPNVVCPQLHKFLTPEKDTLSLSLSIKIFYQMDNAHFSEYAQAARSFVERKYSSSTNVLVLETNYANLLK